MRNTAGVVGVFEALLYPRLFEYIIRVLDIGMDGAGCSERSFFIQGCADRLVIEEEFDGIDAVVDRRAIVPVGCVDADTKAAIYAHGLLVSQRMVSPRGKLAERFIGKIIHGNPADGWGNVVGEPQPEQLRIERRFRFGIAQLEMEVWSLRATRVA